MANGNGNGNGREPSWLRRPADAPYWYPTLPGFMCVALVSMLAGSLVMLLTKPMPISDSAGTLLVAIITFLTTKIATMADFFYGNSTAATAKDKTISDAMAAGSTGTGGGGAKPPVVGGPVTVAGDMNVGDPPPPAQPEPSGVEAPPPGADAARLAAAIEAIDAAAKEGVRALDTAWAELSPPLQAMTEAQYRSLRAVAVATLQEGNTQPKS